MGKTLAKITLIWSPIFIAELILDFFNRGGMFFGNPFLFWIDDRFQLILWAIIGLIAISGSIFTLLEVEYSKKRGGQDCS